MGRNIKTMIADPVLYHTDVGGEIGRALRIIRIEIEECVADGRESASAQSPVDDAVLFIRRVHIIHILGIIDPADRFAHADKLPHLRQDISDIATLVDP